MPPTADERLYDAIIVGGGPAGLSAALFLGRCRRKVLVVDAAEPRNAPAEAMHGYLGHDGIAPAEFRDSCRQEVTRYGVEWLEDRVTNAQRTVPAAGFPTSFRLLTHSTRQLMARKLLFASGMKDRLPPFPGISECFGVSVHQCQYCDGYEHSGERIAVYAEKLDQGAKLAISVRTWSDQVTMLTNGQPLSTENQQWLLAGGVAFRTEPILRFLHEGQRLKGVELAGHGVLPVEALFFITGASPQSDLPYKLGVSKPDPARHGRSQRTNVPGVFLAGDAGGNVKFAILAAAEGATAATTIHQELVAEDDERRRSQGALRPQNKT